MTRNSNKTYKQTTSAMNILISICLALILLVGQQAIAADLTEKMKVAEDKAEVLEQKAAAGGSKARPAPSEVITKG